MSDAIDLKDYYTIKQAAAVLGVGRQRVYDLIKADRLKALKISRDWIVLKEDVENFERLKPWENIKKEKDST